MEDLPEALLAAIVKRVTKRRDLNSLSLVSKRFFTIEAEQKDCIRVGCGLCLRTEDLVSLFSRFPNLWKVEIDYAGWTPSHADQLDNHDLFVILSCCPSLTDLTLNFCSNIDDTGLGYLRYSEKLVSLRLNSATEITSSGLLSVAVGCKSLSSLHLINCKKIGSTESEWLKFGPGWMKLRKLEFEMKGGVWDVHEGYDHMEMDG